MFNSTALAVPLLPAHNIRRLEGVPSEFLQWFSGFTDAEGNFLISIDPRNYVVFRFRIVLHVDDKEVLQKIQKMLGIGVIRITSDTALFVVSDLKSITEVLIPIFAQFPLLTSKSLDYADFLKAINIRLNSSTPKLNSADRSQISNLKTGMNAGRKVIDEIKLTNLTKNYRINPYWLLGFVEGEGTFGIKNLSPYFQIAQHARSAALLEAVKLFLTSLSLKNTSKSSPSISLNKTTNVLSIVISNIDVLYDYIVPFFQGLSFQTRKFVDFQLWVVAVKLHKLGYFYETAGRNLLIAIALSINENRYSTNPKGPVTPPTPEEIAKVLAMKPPFNIKNGDSHHKLSRQLTIEKGGRRGFTVYVYKEGIQIEGSPFSTYGAANRAIGLRSNSRTISRNIDTGKLYKNTYLFTSTVKKD